MIISVEFNIGGSEPHSNASKGGSDWKLVLLTWKQLHSEHCEDSLMSESFIFCCNVLFLPKAATIAFEIAVKCWVLRELARESDRSLSEGTEGTWLQLVRSCALC